jgi:phosphoglucomutase
MTLASSSTVTTVDLPRKRSLTGSTRLQRLLTATRWSTSPTYVSLDRANNRLTAQLDISEVGEFTHGPLKVTIVDPVENYLALLKKIFDFDLIKAYLHESNPKPKVLFDALNGVTGPYGRAIFVDALGLPESSIQNCVPLPDFGGSHPDPNLTYAHSLVERVEAENVAFGAASDGDGDRNMIYGKGAFVTPSDSVAIIADWAEKAIPYFSKANGGVKGLARSMPTSGAIDLVAKERGLEVFEVPTGCGSCQFPMHGLIVRS